MHQCGTNCKERGEGECKGVTKCKYLTSSAKASTTERERESFCTSTAGSKGLYQVYRIGDVCVSSTVQSRHHHHHCI